VLLESLRELVTWVRKEPVRMSVRTAVSTMDTWYATAVAGEVGRLRGSTRNRRKARTAPPKRSVHYPRADNSCLEVAIRSEREDTDSCNFIEERFRFSLASLARAISEQQ